MVKNCQDCGKRPHTQDDLHGEGNRVFNEHRDPKTKSNVRRCTRCGREERSAPQE